MHLDDGADIVLVAFRNAAADQRFRSRIRRSAAHRAAFADLAVQAGIEKLNARERAVLVHRFRHVSEVDDVALVPHPCAPVGLIVGFRVHGGVFDAHRAPAALRLHGAKRGLRSRPVGARAVAVRRLPEPVGRLFRPHRNGFEQDVVFGVARHRLVSPLFCNRFAAKTPARVASFARISAYYTLPQHGAQPPSPAPRQGRPRFARLFRRRPSPSRPASLGTAAPGGLSTSRGFCLKIVHLFLGAL